MCLAFSAGAVITSLSSCATLPVYKTAVADKKITVPTTLFTQSNFQLIQPQGMYYNIGLRKEGDGSYTALLLRCTHADNQLTPAGNNGYTCNLHGSQFDKEGHVTHGPAEHDLKKYPTQIISGNIIINLI
jgi:Rieske Fe-S protein